MSGSFSSKRTREEKEEKQKNFETPEKEGCNKKGKSLMNNLLDRDE